MIEQIDGHFYFVERDEQGNITRKEGRDPINPGVYKLVDGVLIFSGFAPYVIVETPNE